MTGRCARRARTLATLLALASGCSEPSEGCEDTGCEALDDAYEGDLSLEELRWGCDSGWLWVQAVTVGWSSGGAVGVTDGAEPPWVEWHDLPVYADDPDGWWSELYGEWSSVYPDYAAVDEASTTWYDCDTHGASLSFVLEIYEIDGDEAGCSTFGADPDGWASECSERWE